MDEVMCLAGQLWNKTLKACLPCPDGTWNAVPGPNEWCASCTPCYPFSHVLYGCNKTHDNFCICDEGYFRNPSNPSICIRIKKYLLKAVNNFTEGNFVVSNFSTGEQAFNSATTNTSATPDQGCHWTPWLSAWIYPVVVVAIGLICSVFVGLLIYIICKKKSQAKRQQPNAAMMMDPEKNPLVEQQQGVRDEKHNLLWDQENQNSIASDAGNSPSQFNSGGSDQVGIPESCPNVDCSASVRSTAYDRAGSMRNEALPPSSLCEEQEHFHFSLNLREDEYLTPIKEVAEGTCYNT